MSEPTQAPAPFVLNSSRLVRDLKWSVSCAPLIDAESLGLRVQDSPEIRAPHSRFWAELAQASAGFFADPALPERLLAHVQSAQDRHRNKNLRLGIYFETLLEFWLQHAGIYEVLASHRHVSVAQEGSPHRRTLGEVDWIVRQPDSRSQVSEHWECALKFYLLAQTASSPHDCVGPDREDTLARKLSHMIDHQLKVKLPEFEPTHPVCIIKGRVFVEWKPGNPLWSTVSECVSALPQDAGLARTQLAPTAAAGMVVAPKHLGRFHDALETFGNTTSRSSSLSSEPSTCYFVLSKNLWLSEITSDDVAGLEPQTPETLLSKSNEGHRGPLLVAACRARDSGALQELCRFFLPRAPEALAVESNPPGIT